MTNTTRCLGIKYVDELAATVGALWVSSDPNSAYSKIVSCGNHFHLR